MILQPALGFRDHVDHLLNKTATAVACLGNLQKLPLLLALRLFEMKLMSMIRYGLSCIADKLSLSAMVHLDRCKTVYLKSALGMSKHSSNTFVLELTGQRTLCEDLSHMGYRFQPDTWIIYTLLIAAKRAKLSEKDLMTGPAFSSHGWKNANRKDRSAVCRLTYHGFHHHICARKDFYAQADDLCICIYCGERRIDRLHLLLGTYFTGLALTNRVREVTKNCM